ncbi:MULTISPECIES: DNA adenine methylase [Brenneria]|uniref:site-specific DNA-methyltransferase (adenine-specific) n=1 Tax=Brenneria nigrifluens DSM 30175 = ATCC 13028 TaxID=1121120 RepID=A0A2U1UQJ7_9GAMM|nr:MULTISPECIES: DNA adenine methylase [Brenneria]EHD23627.1 phage DNA methylase [Brenneria sp. EniD312]PWC23884.1 DNA adenine methylase [Brenneria nigrifluens] [Brenneria nigrifluens DSM 30175 = ATCC 13028]QCR06555.1 DNA adenine methylase [Brenneria nigrifluens] [Brenneria nigrifluens DSM 30175 = ATCC 13028]
MGYLGSKAASGAYQKIIANMPPHDVYVETHLGGGAVMLNKPPARMNVGVDIDPITVEEFCQFNPDFVDTLDTRLRIINEDAVDFLQSHDLEAMGRTLIYADPPYLLETRTGSARYRHEYTVEDHRDLIAILRQVPCSVMISGYPSALYDELLKGWRSVTFQVMTRGGARTEKLWMNYPESSAYSAKYAGKDYIDRQRIKRKAERWAAKYRAMSSAERLAVMSELNKIDSSL